MRRGFELEEMSARDRGERGIAAKRKSMHGEFRHAPVASEAARHGRLLFMNDQSQNRQCPFGPDVRGTTNLDLYRTDRIGVPLHVRRHDDACRRSDDLRFTEPGSHSTRSLSPIAEDFFPSGANTASPRAPN